MTFSSSSAPTSDAELKCTELNQHCQCIYLDKKTICSDLKPGGPTGLCREIIEQRPYLFAESAVFVSETNIQKQKDIIAAIEKVIALPSYQALVLSYAPNTAQFTPKAYGVFFGYDFHLTPSGPQLIEINSNAGGALLNALILSNHKSCSHLLEPPPTTKQELSYEQLFVQMFYNEWQAERHLTPLRCIAIIDENPQEQYLLPEFLLFKRLFENQGLVVVICDPSELVYRDAKLWQGQQPIDLIYNRLTDFSLEESTHQQLRAAYLAGAVVLTPHPRSHALYADKRNLSVLTNESMLLDMGVDDTTRATLLSGIAHTVRVNANDADTLWRNRKKLFFKPAKGYGSKAAYRGDKLTRRVFDEILQNNYVAQDFVLPGKKHLRVENEVAEFKFDLRLYVYRGKTQLTTARLYQGQTTNFRTPGGGFAYVEVVSENTAIHY